MVWVQQDLQSLTVQKGSKAACFHASCPLMAGVSLDQIPEMSLHQSAHELLKAGLNGMIEPLQQQS